MLIMLLMIAVGWVFFIAAPAWSESQREQIDRKYRRY